MLLVPVSILAETPGSKSQGHLAPACSDGPQCRWVVRFQPTAPAREHEAVKAVLGKLRPVQPISSRVIVRVFWWNGSRTTKL